VDKAPRDFPNDILNELEQMYFRIPELDNVKLEADPDLHPIVVFTSNSEKDLPDAFLRRCVYYHIPFPERARMAEIVANRLGTTGAVASPFLNDALDFFYTLREPASGLRKKPATAELLGWLIAMEQLSDGAENPLVQPALLHRTLSTLVKTAEDQQRASEVANRWINKRTG
jgi:MoxR-like ATPase